MCKGCTLIRCNQKVSKSQVRLRRQKDMEVDLVRMAAGSVEHHQDMRGALSFLFCIRLTWKKCQSITLCNDQCVVG